MHTRLTLAVCLAALVSGVIYPADVIGQSLWLTRSQRSTVALEILKPSYASNVETTFFTATWFISGRVFVSETIALTGELPINHIGISEIDESETDLGNVYLGVEIHNQSATVVTEIGMRLPSADDTAFLGAFTDFVDRADAFATDVFPFIWAVTVQKKGNTGALVRFRPGLTTWIAKGDREDAEIFVTYSLQGGYEAEEFGILAGIGGRWLTTSDNATFGESSYHQLGVAIDFGAGRARPGLTVRVPLDEDLRDVLDIAYGLTVSIDVSQSR